jgi:hypothetical protein
VVQAVDQDTVEVVELVVIVHQVMVQVHFKVVHYL